ncbi:MAG: hypothetical protein HUU20_28075, partial [Pirellulales bacterium]|nr:hypothetical protein [Pirellulales bacterium]
TASNRTTRLRLPGCKYPQHRAVRKRLLEAGRRLVEMTEAEFQAAQLETAEALMNLAARCMAIEGNAQALQQRIREAIQDKQRRETWLAAQFDEAHNLAEAGQLHSALDVLAHLGEHSRGAELRASVEQRLAQFARQVEASRRCLEAGQAEAAHRHWYKARQIMPEDPQLDELATAIAQAMSAASPAARQPIAVNNRAQGFLLGDLALVVSAGEVCLGTPRAEGVHVPIQGPLHRRHAVLVRDGTGWQLAACRDAHGQPCAARVSGRQIESLCRLADGDLLQLGGPSCTWRFRLPVAGSTTAVLEAAPGTRALVWTAAGKLLSRVVLLDEEMVLRACLPAHIVLSELACEELAFRWRQGRLHWQSQGGLVRVERPYRTSDQPDNQVYLPCRLMIEPQLSEAELLGRAAAGCPPVDRLVLELTDPFSRRGLIA